jgi:hypothetical protein
MEHKVSVFSSPVNNRVIKIACFQFQHGTTGNTEMFVGYNQ